MTTPGAVTVEAVNPLPPPEVWSTFCKHMADLAHKNAMRIGEPDKREDLTEPIIAVMELLLAYHPPLTGGVGRLAVAVNDSLTGKPHPLFIRTPKPTMPTIMELTYAAAGIAVRDLNERRSGSNTTIVAAAHAVYEHILTGKRPRPEKFTWKTVRGWHTRLEKAAKDNAGDKPPPAKALRIYMDSLKEEDREKRLADAMDWLGKGSM